MSTPQQTPRYTLPKRLKKRKYFLLAAHNGRKFLSKGLIVQIIPNNKEDIKRVGFTTTKKLGCAVVRNRVRRLMREVCRLEFSKAPGGFDYVFIGRLSAIERPLEALRKDARYILATFQNELSEKQKQKAIAQNKGDTRTAVSQKADEETDISTAVGAENV